MSTAFTISRLATAAGVHVETVRYYQRRGLLPEPSRPRGGIRRYDLSVLTRLQFIRRAQAMGFSLDEIAGLLEVRGASACERTRRATETKLAEVRCKLEDLRRLESELVQRVAECVQTRPDTGCPTLGRLENAASGAPPARPPRRRKAREAAQDIPLP